MGANLLEFIRLQGEYLELKKIVEAESDDLKYPSDNRQKLWSAGSNLAKIFREAVRDTISS